MFRLILAAALLAFGTSARSTDLSDLWWNAAESGWGVNVAQQDDILFLTFFVYGANGQPTWYSASSVQFQNTTSSGGLVYSGSLAQTTGPYYGAAFNSAPVVGTVVGTVTFVASTTTTATLTYNVGGTTVTRQVTRLTFRANPFVNGNYFGGIVSDVSGCANPANNGHVEGQTIMSVSGASTTQIVIQGSVGSCTLSGAYRQDGRMGNIQGQSSCTSGMSGSVAVFEMEGNASGFTTRFQAQYANGCTETGRFAGVRR
jgi:hypothetical protein